MNNKMKTAISIIAAACLCACTPTNEQAKIQPPRTAYTAPAKENYWEEKWEEIDNKMKEEIHKWTDLFLSQSYLYTKIQLTEEEKMFDRHVFMRLYLPVWDTISEAEQIKIFRVCQYQRIVEEMRRRRIIPPTKFPRKEEDIQKFPSPENANE